MRMGPRDRWTQAIQSFAGNDSHELQESRRFVVESLHSCECSARCAAILAGYAWWHMEDFPEYYEAIVWTLSCFDDESWNTACSITGLAYVGMKKREVLGALVRVAQNETRSAFQRNCAYRVCHVVFDRAMEGWASNSLAIDIQEMIGGREEHTVDIIQMDPEFLERVRRT